MGDLVNIFFIFDDSVVEVFGEDILKMLDVRII